MIVELVDDSVSPFLVRTDQGFEFYISAEDFRSYYRPEGDPTPSRWAHLVTDRERGMVDSVKMAELMEIIRPFEEAFQDYGKARVFVRDAMGIIGRKTPSEKKDLLELLERAGSHGGGITDQDLARLNKVQPDLRDLLADESCAVPRVPMGTNGEESVIEPTLAPTASTSRPKAKQSSGKTPAKPRRAGMKNAEMTVDGDTLAIVVDLGKDLGPSKSGKTRIVASSEGNKSVPGREEKLGLNVYREVNGDSAKKGRRRSFKNVETAVEGDTLRITVDLSKEFGPSKSGKTIIVASTEGNQRVYGREERIGLNVYKKKD